MPRFYPNALLSDCWSSIGNITFYHRDGICYFKSKPYTNFAGTMQQMELQNLHRRAIRAWQGLRHQDQQNWRAFAHVVTAHRPPYDKKNHISGYNLFLSAYHGFAQLGNEHIPSPKCFEPFPIFGMDLIGCRKRALSDIELKFKLTLCGCQDPSRYRILAKVQLTEPGRGRNPGLMRNYLSQSIPSAKESEILLTLPDTIPLHEIKQLHIRYLLLDALTGYRSQYHPLSTLASTE